MKKVLLLLGIAILLFVAFILFNTFTFKSKQLSAPEKPAFAASDSSVSRLQQAITYQTVSFEDSSKLDSNAFLGFHAFLMKSFPRIFKTVTVEKVHKYSLLLHWKGKSSAGSPLVMMAHQDVVPIEEATIQKWDAAPFAGALKNGFVYGRGTIDDKGSLMALLEGVEALMREGFVPENDIYISMGHDEEVGGKGAKAIAELFKARNIKPGVVVDEGGIITKNKIPGLSKPVAIVGIAEKGYVTLDLQINIPGGHSSMPEKETAIDEMAKAVVKLKENPFPEEMGYVLNSFLDYVGPEMSFISKMAMANRTIFKPLIFNAYKGTAAGNAMIRTTTATTIFKAGIKDNVVPGQANATVNFRTQPGTTREDVIAYVKKVIGNDKVEITARPVGTNPKQVADVNDKSFTHMQNTINGWDSKLIVTPYLVLGATDSKSFSELTQQIFRFIPFTDPEGFHGVNERINAEDYKKGIGFYYQYLKYYKF
ncbi:M20/M25/M40 family metallo-hydrolase [Dyadobacter subterraneus]|uniref:M20/M25/M40 family metallo-hydrolase n=1 Tax=Dyadobacter subterraneus TaxID=2773304 RepID=A0ABR9WFK7_9BACT|nr:M20/M25/M40 family metallo-hydrolase [Dyadobacter subterraneus]MBE9464292.1 M20/M25/M40 family metallo-hydrolase [Dyadobacter subterraneus]